MNRGLLLLLAIVGGAIAAYVAVLAIGGALVGVLWIYVFGDDPWPNGWEVAVGIILAVLGALAWIAAGRAIWRRFAPPAEG
ncbi:MAG: hypothetical protein ACJ8EH_10815 [Sphingomicrobium sp.]